MPSSDLVRESVATAIRNADAVRKATATARIAAYGDDYKQLIIEELARQFSAETVDYIKQMVDDSNNVLKRIINEISTVYKEGAIRRAINPEDMTEFDANYSDWQASLPVDLVTEKVNQMTNLCNEALIKITPRNGRIEYDVLKVDIVDVIPMDDDNTRPQAIIYAETFYESYPDIVATRYVYWDIWGQHHIFDSELVEIPIENNPENINPYKDPANPGRTILPFVIFHRELNTDAIFDPASGNDLYSLNIQTGVLLTYLNFLLKVNSFKQLAMSGVDPKSLNLNQVMDPTYPFVVANPEAKINILDYQADFDKVWGTVQNKVTAVASNYGLSAEALKMEISASSGFALQIKKEGLEDIRKKQVKLYRWSELELYQKTVIINNYHFPEKAMQEDFKFLVDFKEPAMATDDQNVRDNWTFWLKTGARSLADFVRFLNPDIESDDDAMEAVRKNMEINDRARTEFGIDLSSLASGGSGAGAGQAQGGALV